MQGACSPARPAGSARPSPRPAPARTRACARPSTPRSGDRERGGAGTEERVSVRRRGLGRSALHVCAGGGAPDTPCCSRPRPCTWRTDGKAASASCGTRRCRTRGTWRPRAQLPVRVPVRGRQQRMRECARYNPRCALEAAQNTRAWSPSQAQNMQQIPGACWQTHAHAPARPTAQRPPCSAEDGKAPRVRGACEHHRARGTTGCRWRRSPTRRRWRPKCIGGCLPPAPSATPTTVTNQVARARVLARSLACMHACMHARARMRACTPREALRQYVLMLVT